MNDNILVGYHATTTDNADLILTNGFIESQATEGHWLGRGVYFFDDLYYAIEWGIIGVIKQNIKRYKQLRDKCSILISDINIREYRVIDFSTPQGFAIFQHLLEEIKKNYPNEKYKAIEEKGYAYIIRVLEELEKAKGEEYISGFDVVCAVYPKKIDKKQKNLPGNFISCVQKQICVKNVKTIENLRKMPYSEITEGIFGLVIQNRGGKK